MCPPAPSFFSCSMVSFALSPMPEAYGSAYGTVCSRARARILSRDRNIANVSFEPPFFYWCFLLRYFVLYAPPFLAVPDRSFGNRQDILILPRSSPPKAYFDFPSPHAPFTFNYWQVLALGWASRALTARRGTGSSPVPTGVVPTGCKVSVDAAAPTHQ